MVDLFEDRRYMYEPDIIWLDRMIHSFEKDRYRN